MGNERISNREYFGFHIVQSRFDLIDFSLYGTRLLLVNRCLRTNSNDVISDKFKPQYIENKIIKKFNQKGQIYLSLSFVTKPML